MVGLVLRRPHDRAERVAVTGGGGGKVGDGNGYVVQAADHGTLPLQSRVSTSDPGRAKAPGLSQATCGAALTAH
ncbi:hypothetical protein GCM10007893_05230 [Paracoccus marinus]|nr:hypothetical protein GCM10007893_05230 [Paracoccus marinus]